MSKTRFRPADAKVTKRLTKFSASNYEAPEIKADETPQVEEILLFSFLPPGGDPETDTQSFYVPIEVDRALSIAAMAEYTAGGESAMVIFMIRKVLGDAGYKLLTTIPCPIPNEQYDTIIDALMQIAVGDQGKE